MKERRFSRICKKVFLISLPAILLLTGCGKAPVNIRRINYVDTRVGTAASVTHTAGLFGKGSEEYGQTLPAVLEPNGMNFWTPQTQDTEQKCVAPYYYRDSLLQGFRNSHWITGGCTQDYGSMTLMPLADSLRTQPAERASRFSHEKELATPACYLVHLPDEGITAAMTGRSRSAIFRFKYSRTGKGYLVVNPNSDEGEGFIEVDTLRREIRGYNPVHRIYQGWGEPAGYSGHFIVRLQKPITAFGTYCGSERFPGKTRIANRRVIGLYVEFEVEAGEEVLVKAASSFVDKEGAVKNLEAEIPHWDFGLTCNELIRTWEERFALVDVQGGQPDELAKFYGAFYRASFLPRTFNDVDGRYPSFATGQPVRDLDKGQAAYYEDFSMWDTYRALHPFINLITPERAGDMMQSLVLKYEQGGWLPIFPCWNSYTSAMIGDHCTSALADAYIKGIRNFDFNKAYEAMRKNAFETPLLKKDYQDGMGRRAIGSYIDYGYIPLEDSVPDAFHTREQVSRTLEYAYDDFALAQMANDLDLVKDRAMLMVRALNYRNVIDPRTGYANARHADGRFLEREADAPFRFAEYITEGAPCHYTWYVPHDPYGLMELMGGQEAFTAKLDSMFSEGRYWHGNEPCHQIPFLFNYAGQPWKTQQAVRHIMQTEYLNEPGGLAGNDDAGQMSAWYLFAAMGFYPVCPGTPYYVLYAPAFPEITLKLDELGRHFTIRAKGLSEQNVYIQSARLNGQPYTHNYIDHETLTRGGLLEFTMGAEPNADWGTRPEDCPPDVMQLPVPPIRIQDVAKEE